MTMRTLQYVCQKTVQTVNGWHDVDEPTSIFARIPQRSFRQADVEDLHLAISRDLDICGFEIAMIHAALMRLRVPVAG